MGNARQRQARGATGHGGDPESAASGPRNSQRAGAVLADAGSSNALFELASLFSIDTPSDAVEPAVSQTSERKGDSSLSMKDGLKLGETLTDETVVGDPDAKDVVRTQSERSNKLKVTSDTVDVKRGRKATAQVGADKRTNGRELGFGLGSDGLHGDASRSSRVEDAASATESRQSVGFGGGQLKLGGGRTDEQKRVVQEEVDGELKDVKKTQGRSRDTSVAVGLDKASFGQKRGRTHEDGSSSSVNANASFDWETGTTAVGGGYSRKDAKGNAQSVSGSASMQRDADGNLTAASVDGAATSGKLSVTAHAGMSVEASEPEEVDGRYVVTWKRTEDVGAGTGVKGKKVGASVGVTHAAFDTGTRSFASKEEAEAFRTHAAERIRLNTPDPTTVGGALALEVGESRGHGSTTGDSASASGTAGGLTVGAGVNASANSQVSVRRVSANLFDATYAGGTGTGANLSAGGFGVTASRDVSDTESHAVTVRFDLSTTEGQAAYESFCRTHEVPETGGRVLSEKEAKSHEVGEGLSLAGLGSSRFAGRTWEDTTWDEKGKHEAYGGESSESHHNGRIGRWLGGKDSSSKMEVIGRQEDDQDAGYTLRGEFGGEVGSQNLDHMYQMTGRNDARDRGDIEDAKSSGTWRVSADMSNEQIDEYAHYLTEARDYKHGAISDVQEGLRNAKSNDDKMRAIAGYVAEDGYKALRDLGARDLSWDVELKGDPNFPGRAGRVAIEAKIDRYGALLAASGASGSSIVGPLQGEIDALQKRRDAVADAKRYADMPGQLRAEELHKIDSHLAAFTTLRDQASIEAVKNNPGEDMVGMLDRQEAEAKDPGLLPTDPAQRRLHDLRDELATVQFELARVEAENADLHALIKQEVRRVRNDEGAREVYRRYSGASKEARALDDVRHAMGAGIPALRMAFLGCLSNPELALGVGGVLLAQLNAELSLAMDAGTKWTEAEQGAAELSLG